jgi:hypothetical protein
MALRLFIVSIGNIDYSVEYKDYVSVRFPVAFGAFYRR